MPRCDARAGLWNAFFSDVAGPASHGEKEVALFADDLSAFKSFPLDLDNATIVTEMQRTRADVHRWGQRNRVIFDSSKEHIIIIHPRHGHGDTFKLLGCPIDVKLTMLDAVDYVCARARPKIKALLRSRPYYNVSDLIIQFKTRI